MHVTAKIFELQKVYVEKPTLEEVCHFIHKTLNVQEVTMFILLDTKKFYTAL
jgi:hypothetical protein